MVDTGSTGVVVSARFVGPDAQRTGERFTLLYTSSGRTYEGEYVWAQVELSARLEVGAQGSAQASTVRMKVRVVERAKASKDAPWESAESLWTCMLGVGFDRDTGSGLVDPGGHVIPPDINPFLRLEAMVHGVMTPGFIVDLRTRTITLGLTDANTAGFELVQLARQDPKPPHAKEAGWAAPNVWLTVPAGGVAPLQTGLLVDTGLGYSIVQAPLGIAPPQAAVMYVASADTANCRVQVADGQRVALTAIGADKPFYEFVVGTPGQAPDYVSWRHNVELHGGMPFINTSRHALNQFEYLYDNQHGRIGFRFFHE